MIIFNTPQIIIITIFITTITPMLIKIFKKIKIEIDTEIIILNLVTACGFSWSLIIGLKALWFALTEQYAKYGLPEEYVIYMEIGVIVLIISSTIAYYRFNFRDIIKK